MSIPNNTYMDRYIIDGQAAVLSLRNLYDTLLVTNIDDRESIYRIPTYDFFLKYRTQLEDIVQEFNVPDELFYKPKSVSLSIYGTTELWLSLMRLNCFRNITEFNQSVINIYNPPKLKELISIFFKRDGKFA